MAKSSKVVNCGKRKLRKAYKYYEFFPNIILIVKIAYDLEIDKNLTIFISLRQSL